MVQDRLRHVNAVNTIVASAEAAIYEATKARVRLLVVGEVPRDGNQGNAMADVIANALGMGPTDYCVKSRKPQYTHLRQLICLFLRNYYKELSLIDIGEVCGGIDHTTVLYSIAAANAMIDTRDNIFYPKYEQALQAVTQWDTE